MRALSSHWLPTPLPPVQQQENDPLMDKKNSSSDPAASAPSTEDERPEFLSELYRFATRDELCVADVLCYGTGPTGWDDRLRERCIRPPDGLVVVVDSGESDEEAIDGCPVVLLERRAVPWLHQQVNELLGPRRGCARVREGFVPDDVLWGENADYSREEVTRYFELLGSDDDEENCPAVYLLDTSGGLDWSLDGRGYPSTYVLLETLYQQGLLTTGDVPHDSLTAAVCNVAGLSRDWHPDDEAPPGSKEARRLDASLAKIRAVVADAEQPIQVRDALVALLAFHDDRFKDEEPSQGEDEDAADE